MSVIKHLQIGQDIEELRMESNPVFVENCLQIILTETCQEQKLRELRIKSEVAPIIDFLVKKCAPKSISSRYHLDIRTNSQLIVFENAIVADHVMEYENKTRKGLFRPCLLKVS